MNFDEMCELLKSKGFRRTSLEGASKWTFVDKDYKLYVTVEENTSELTDKEEEAIKDRLRELGYLD